MRARTIGLENLIDGLSKQFGRPAGLPADGRSARRVPGRVRPDARRARPPSSGRSTPATPTRSWPRRSRSRPGMTAYGAIRGPRAPGWSRRPSSSGCSASSASAAVRWLPAASVGRGAGRPAEVAGDEVLVARVEQRRLVVAQIAGPPSSARSWQRGWKWQPLGGLTGRGHVAAEDDPLPAQLRVRDRDRRHQRLGVGMLGRAEHLAAARPARRPCRGTSPRPGR